jgi:hypothetical protein
VVKNTEDGFLNQNCLLLSEIFLQHGFTCQRNWGSFSIALIMLIMNQRFADQADLQIRILQLPDLTAFKWLQGDSALLFHDFQAAIVSEHSI